MDRVVRFERSATATGRGRQTAQGIGRDISSQGISILTVCPLRMGEILKLHVPLEADRASVPVYSEVRWARPEHEGFCVGLQFLS
jgi:hypothetical protein